MNGIRDIEKLLNEWISSTWGISLLIHLDNLYPKFD